MKYTAVLDTDDFKDFEFFEDGNGKYLHAIDAGAINGEWIYLPFKPIEQKPQTGYWIPLGNYDDYGIENSYKCSECSDINTYYDNYCPNCGCRMVEIKNEDNN